MIPCLVGWTQIRRKDSLLLIPKEGRSVGYITYHERLRPLARIGELVRDLAPRLDDAYVGKPEILVTIEGEHAALVTISGTLDGAPAQRDVGFVFGDDFYARTSALCLRPTEFGRFTARVRGLVLRDSHALGIRRRRFVYTPPRAWQPLVFGQHTEWIPPDYPANGATMTVAPASPAAFPPEQVFASLLAEDVAGGFTIATRKGPKRVLSDSGLSGLVWEVTGNFPGRAQQYKCVVVFADGRYLYTMQLDSHVDERRSEHGAAFLKVVRSARPIPTGSTAPILPDALIDHWLG